MNREVKKAIAEFHMLKNTTGIVLGLSGGADSVTLLCILEALCKGKNITIYAAHINHMLRGKEADRDEFFVKTLCKEKNIELFVLKSDIKKEAKENGESLEECGRRIRYHFFNEVLEKTKSQKIATAHTQNDNAETLLFNLTRGTGLHGLCGILPVRDNIIRPLIYATRAQVENYLASIGQEYINDSSNFSDEYTRNKIRNNVLPLLKEINPSLFEATKRLSSSCYKDEEYLTQNAKKALADADFDGVSLLQRVLLLQDECIAIRALKIACQKALHISIDFEKALELKALLNKKTSKKVQIKGNFFAYISYDRLFFALENKKEKQNELYNLVIGENILPNGKKITIKSEKINKIDLNNYMDCDIINGKFIARTRQTGDYFHPKGKSGGKSLKKLLIDYKIPLQLRDELIVICDEEEIVFVEGLGICQNKAIKTIGEKGLIINVD